MLEHARERILQRLRMAVGDRRDIPAVPAALQTETLSREEKLERLKTLMTAMRTEVHVVPKADPGLAWTDRLKEILREKRLKQMLYAPGTPVGEAVKSSLGRRG